LDLALVLSEPFLIPMAPKSKFGFLLQLIVLAVSTVTFGIQIYGESVDKRDVNVKYKLIHINLRTKPLQTRIAFFVNEFVGRFAFIHFVFVV
jgi:hypothetical protein